MTAHRRLFAASCLLLVAAVAVALFWLGQRGLPKRFGVVEEGRLYRCGEVTPRELERVTRTYGLRTVLSLLNPDAPESVAEREAAEQLGLRWVNVPLPGNGASTPEQRERIRAVLLDSDTVPVLVHCGAGTNRTGLAVGMHRFHRQGWTLEQVLDEMRDYDYEDTAQHQNLRDALAAEWQAARFADQASTRPAPP